MFVKLIAKEIEAHYGKALFKDTSGIYEVFIHDTTDGNRRENALRSEQYYMVKCDGEEADTVSGDLNGAYFFYKKPNLMDLPWKNKELKGYTHVKATYAEIYYPDNETAATHLLQTMEVYF